MFARDAAEKYPLATTPGTVPTAQGLDGRIDGIQLLLQSNMSDAPVRARYSVGLNTLFFRLKFLRNIEATTSAVPFLHLDHVFYAFGSSALVTMSSHVSPISASRLFAANSANSSCTGRIHEA